MKEVFRQIGFFLLGICSLFYIVSVRNFAEIRIQIPFFNFPIFIGEILLFMCLVLSFFIFDFRSVKGWRWGVVFYFACVILKALWGYYLWGPLAFRHAALLYYPAFIFLGFIFYKKGFLPEYLKIVIVALILSLCITKYFYEYWVFALWVIAFILIKSFNHRTAKYFFYTGLLSAVFITYKNFILTSRTFTVGNISAIFFLLVIFLFLIKVKVVYKVVFVGVVFILLAIFMYKLSISNASFGTILDIKNTIALYKITDAEIKGLKPYFIPQVLTDIQLFNPEQISNKKILPKKPYSFPVNARVRKEQIERIKEQEALIKNETIQERKGNDRNNLLNKFRSNMYGASISKSKAKAINYDDLIFNLLIWRDMIFDFPINQMVQKRKSCNNAEDDIYKKFVNIQIDGKIVEKETKSIAYGNSMFRIFIWRDMIFEFLRYRPIVGFSFGKPFRSESMEILYQANGEWERDGWIEPHNSYLNIIYRMGILGIILIGFLIWQLCFMINNFIKFKSITGILLCSVLINWSIAANFLPILELPYNAIPFWALWGVALGYLKELKNKRQNL